MSLSTQLTRGTLALPLLALFAALALSSGQPADAQALPTPTAALVLQVVEPAVCAVAARPQLPLALAPADLGPIAQRQLHVLLAPGCRA